MTFRWFVFALVLGAAARLLHADDRIALEPVEQTTAAAASVATDVAGLPPEELGSSAEPVDASYVSSSHPVGGSVWLYSTRNLGSNCTGHDPRAGRIWRYECGHGWHAADWDAFHATDDPHEITVFIIFGNMYNSDSTARDGLICWRRITACQANERPIRFVIWSWPSDYVPGLIIRYSFGGRIACGALHALATGELDRHSIGIEPGPRQAPCRAVLVAGALDQDWILPNRRFGGALSMVDRMAVIFNPDDIVLKRYWRLAKRGSVTALGHYGPVGTSQLGDERKKLQLYNSNCQLGHRHAWPAYQSSGGLMRVIGDQATFADEVTAAQPAANTTAQDGTTLPESESAAIEVIDQLGPQLVPPTAGDDASSKEPIPATGL